MAYNPNASSDWNAQNTASALGQILGNVVTTTGISYSTSPTDEIILVSGAIAPIFINLVTSGLLAGKMYTVKDVGTATAGTNGIVISGLPASINGVSSGMSMTSGYSNSPTAAAAKTYNKVSFVFDGQGLWSVV